MAKDYGPWVRHDWCPACFRRTEQTRLYRRLFGEDFDRFEHRIRCNECSSDLTVHAEAG